MKNAKPAVLFGGVACSVAMVAGDIARRDAQTNDAADIAARRAGWLTDRGVAAPTRPVDRESGCAEGENVPEVPGYSQAVGLVPTSFQHPPSKALAKAS